MTQVVQFPVPEAVETHDDILVDALVSRVAAVQYPLNEYGDFESFEFEPSRERWQWEMDCCISQAAQFTGPHCLRMVANCTLVPAPEQLTEEHVHEFCSAIAECRVYENRDEKVTMRWKLSFGNEWRTRERDYNLDDAMADWPWPGDQGAAA